MYCDNTHVCDTSISWFEADKTPVIITALPAFVLLAKASGFSAARFHMTDMEKQSSKVDKIFVLLTWPSTQR